MADTIRLSALGRDARVGDFYNYFTDAILISEIEIPNDRKIISNEGRKTTLSFFYQQPYKFKRHILGINSHLMQTIEKGLPDFHQPWFANYLSTIPKADDEEKAQVTAFFRVERRTDALDQDFRRSQMFEYQLRSGGRATHLVGQVVYGAEVICSMRRPLNLDEETKESAEQSIYLAAKEHFEQIISGKSPSKDIPTKLDKIFCTVSSSLKTGGQIKMPFMEFGEYLRKICNSDNDDNSPRWKPVDLLLISIPAQVETRLWADRRSDFAFEMERNRDKWTWIQKAITSISNYAHINRFPRFANVIRQFQNLLPDFCRKIDESYKAIEPCHPEEALEKIRPISDLLNAIIDWLAQRTNEIEKFSSLTKDTQLFALDLAEIMAKQDKKSVKVFALKVDYKEDPIIVNMLKVVGHQTLVPTLPVFPIFSEEKEFQSVRSALKVFVEKSKQIDASLHGETSYYIGLVPVSSTVDNGATMNYDSSGWLVQTIPRDSSSSSPGYPHSTTTQDLKQNQQGRMGDAGLAQSVERFDQPNPSADKGTPMEWDDLLAFSSDSEKGDDDSKMTQFFKQKKTEPSFEQRNASCDRVKIKAEQERQKLPVAQLDQFKLDGKKLVAPLQSAASKFEKSVRDNRSLGCSSPTKSFSDIPAHKTPVSELPAQSKTLNKQQEKVSAVLDYKDCARDKENTENELERERNSGPTPQRNAASRELRRIAETFIDERTQCSERIKTGSPHIYLLNAEEKSNSGNIKWFDICQPSGCSRSRDHKAHKTIILMGATGSGKSTLINGMINYILGVQWDDPFRFKCVREDENAARNQAHSQTSSVTAYTLHHEEGMTIPYSITIIDTPGYGDTRGVKRDKEITAAIHSFLTQQEIPIDEIHAACFVAASGDSRLTATQRYIIDSVLSIFGKDMKENLRLLVTFADNADPPVVGACLSANFPATSDGIAYSKFNSSVLYCSNVKQGDDEFSFDQLFWDMGHENFKKFFSMLEGMNGRDLTSTREVIHSRRQLEQSLKGIEQEMEMCLTKIENIEIFQRKMKTCGHNMEATKNFSVEQTNMRLRKFKCDKGYFAYNCDNCNVTCETLVAKKSPLHKKKRRCEVDACKCPPSDHSVEDMEWRLIKETVTRTMLDMKAQYQSNYEGKMTAENLLKASSDKLQVARVKVLSLLDQVAKNVDLLESTALRSNVLSPSDYLSLMRSRVMEEQAPGYLTRLETLDDIQQMLASGTSQPIRNTLATPNQDLTLQSPNTDRAKYSVATSSNRQAPNDEQTTQHTQASNGNRYTKLLSPLKFWK